MKIGLLDVDSRHFPNLAQMKLSAWHKSQGDTVERWMAIDRYDLVYQSKVFTFTPDIDVLNADTVVKGGTGYDLQNKLSDAVEAMQPDYGLYPEYPEAYGFITRGCPNNCAFCIVSKKEGRCSKQVADVKEFKSDRKVIKLLDPNLLACKNREKLLQQLAESKAHIDFTQGVDARLTDKDVITQLNQIKIKMIHFAWDLMKNSESILKGLELYASKGKIQDFRRRRVYILTNFDTTIEEDLYRIYKMREMLYDPYVMIYDKGEYVNSNGKPKPMRLLLQKYTAEQIEHFAQIHRISRWVNNKYVWRTCERYEDYDTKIG